MFMPPGSMPVWTYWFWGAVGLFVLWYGATSIIYRDDHGPHIDLMGIFECVLGGFLILYWADKVGLV